MRSAIDRAVVIRLLADPHAVRDFGDHRTADRTIGADILADRHRCTRGSRRAGLGLAYAAERETAERGERARGNAGTLQETAAIQTNARFTRFVAGSFTAITMTLRLPDQQGRLPYRAG